VRELDRHPRTVDLVPRTATGRARGEHAAPTRADLLVTTMPSSASSAASADAVAEFAALQLRLGGVFTVLTHCHWNSGTLVDPTGPMVAAAQNADLLYLQHIVAVHLPPNHPPLRHATRTGWGGPHQRVHSDVLVFAQPHHQTADPDTLSGLATPDPQP
jgi:hypothetical protein